MKKKANVRRRGFTLIELLIVVAVLAVVIGIPVFGTVGMGNYWVSDQGALECVRVVDKTQQTIVQISRGVWGYTKMTTEDDDGVRRTFILDTDVLWNAECAASSEDLE